MKGNNMKKQRKFNIAYLLCLVPILSIAAFAGLLLLPDKFIYLGSVPIWTPIGQQNVSGISVLSVLAVILAALAWGYCGSFAAKKRLGLTASMLTANAMSGASQEYMDMGFDGYLSKPINPGELYEMVNRLVVK